MHVQVSHSAAAVPLIALLGSIMLLLDRCIPNLPRERSIVAHVRLNSSLPSVSNEAPAVARLFASTGFQTSSTKQPSGEHNVRESV